MKFLFSRKLIPALCALTLVFAGCAQKSEPSATIPLGAPQQKLQFSVVESEQPGYTKVELGENADVDVMAYGCLDAVNLQVDGAEMPLAEAIRSEKITTPELFAFARMDAGNGYCEESYTSTRGLNTFVYAYPECALHIIYDVYETPDGRQTLINEIYVYDITDDYRSISSFFIDEDSKWGYFLDREDWGLTFHVAEVSPTRLTLDCTQQGGQQIGELSIHGYDIYRAEEYDDPDIAARPLNDRNAESTELPPTLLPNASSQITLDWSDLIGALEPGDYYLKLGVRDVYDESQRHPLIVKYHDRQGYYVAFSVQ